MTRHYLELKHSISRAQDTYGYNIVTLWEGKKRYSCNGGGYDMIGTCLALWLESHYHNRLASLDPKRPGEPNENYGLFKAFDDIPYLDGSCGLECMIKIAEKIGLNVMQLTNKKGHITGFIVREKE